MRRRKVIIVTEHVQFTDIWDEKPAIVVVRHNDTKHTLMVRDGTDRTRAESFFRSSPCYERNDAGNLVATNLGLQPLLEDLKHVFGDNLDIDDRLPVPSFDRGDQP